MMLAHRNLLSVSISENEEKFIRERGRQRQKRRRKREMGVQKMLNKHMLCDDHGSNGQ